MKTHPVHVGWNLFAKDLILQENRLLSDKDSTVAILLAMLIGSHEGDQLLLLHPFGSISALLFIRSDVLLVMVSPGAG